MIKHRNHHHHLHHNEGQATKSLKHKIQNLIKNLILKGLSRYIVFKRRSLQMMSEEQGDQGQFMVEEGSGFSQLYLLR